MERPSLYRMVLVALALTGCVAAQEEPRPRLQMDLFDGCRLIGVPTVESLAWESPYGAMELPLEQIHSITVGEDPATATLEMRNGDKLRGKIMTDPIELDTVFGRVAVGMVHIREVQVGAAGGKLSGGALPLAQAASGATSEGLVAHYSFDTDEGGSVSDSSPAGGSGLVRGARWTTRGEGDGAYALDGVDDHIAIDEQVLGPGTKELTVAIWVNANRMTSCAGLLCDRYKPLSMHRIRGLALGSRGGMQPGIYVPGKAVFAPEGAMQPGRWTHVVGVWKAQEILRLYIDGQLSVDADKDAPGVTTNKSGKWKIGWDEDQRSRRFNGQVDDARLYDRALTAEEVRASTRRREAAIPGERRAQ